MTHARIGSLFTGVGGLDRAVESVFGGTVVWHSEIDEAANLVLRHRNPDVPNHGDIATADWARAEPVDVLCGGFPCQDVTHYPANPECGIDEPYRVLNIPRDTKNRNRCALHDSGMTALQPGNEFNPFERGHPGWTVMRRVGKKAAGRELDGRTWDQYPEAVTV